MNTFTAEYQTKLTDFTSVVDTVFIGWAEVGTAESSLGWTIQRIQFDVDGNPTALRWTLKNNAIWDNRVSETYL